MGRYSGQKCAVCSERFRDDADVVVCPVCGTPHHRQCWIDYGGCRNAGLHGTDFQWKPTAAASDHPDFDEKKDLGEICPVCGRNNPQNTLFCPGCGTPLGKGQPRPGPSGTPPFTSPFGSPYPPPFDDRQTLRGIPVQEIAAIIKVNPFSYIQKFLKMERKKVPVSFNWAAFLFGPFWFIYRRMYAAGGILIALLLALGIAMAPAVNAAYEEINDFYAALEGSSAAQMEADSVQLLKSANVQAVLVERAVNLAAMVAMGFAANPLYRRCVVRRAKKARAIGETQAREKFFRYWSGINIWAVIVVYLLYQLIGMAVSYLLF